MPGHIYRSLKPGIDFSHTEGAGSLQFRPMGKVLGIKNTGNEPLADISIFSPALKGPDRHFVE